MRVLVACEYSGIVRDAFSKQGHMAFSCDMRETERKGPHIQGDVLNHLKDGWDLMIAHPPCTYLCNSGVRWLYEEEERWKDLIGGADFFLKLWEAPIPKICIENPVMHKWAQKIIRQEPNQYIQPYEFGHDASKKTGLWLKNLEPLKPTEKIRKETYANQTPSGQNKRPPSEDRSKERARFWPGVAEAMAEQWGSNDGV